jgi:hypothetical protein
MQKFFTSPRMGEVGPEGRVRAAGDLLPRRCRRVDADFEARGVGGPQILVDPG